MPKQKPEKGRDLAGQAAAAWTLAGGQSAGSEQLLAHHLFCVHMHLYYYICYPIFLFLFAS